MRLRIHWSSVLLSLALSLALALEGDRTVVDTDQPPCQGFCVVVTPDGLDWHNLNENGSSSYSFTVHNNSQNFADDYILSCRGDGGVSCTSMSQSGASLGPGESVEVTVGYSAGSTGGKLWFKAFSDSQSKDSGYVNVAIKPIVTLVSPNGWLGVTSRRPRIEINYNAGSELIDTTSIFVKYGNDTVTNFVTYNSRMAEWQPHAGQELQDGVSRTLTFRVCNVRGGCTTKNWSFEVDDSGAPFVSFTGIPLRALGRQFSAPFGPGISVSGAEVETGFSTPSYTSFGVERSLGFVYSTRQSYPRALVNTDVELTWPVGTPSQIKAVLIDGIVRMDSLVVNSPSCASGGGGRRCRVTLQGDFSGTTGTVMQRKWLKVEVSVTSGGTTKTTTDSTEVVIVDRRASSYGKGWFAGIPRMYFAGNDAIIVAPNGSASIYRGTSDNVYLSPPGDGMALVKSGSSWELRAPDGAKMSFDATGRMLTARDRYNNTTTYSYHSTSDRLTLITDPVGHRFVIDSTTNRLTVTDSMPGYSSVRRSTLSIKFGVLLYDSVASPAARPATAAYSYTSVGSNGAVVLASRTDAAGSLTTIAYDGRTRPTTSTLPAVLPETGGSTQSPVITYRAQELRGLDSLLSADSIFVQIKDPLNNWTRSVLNRWGASERTWDALGTVSRASYQFNGAPRWTEGKRADSTRVYWSSPTPVDALLACAE